MSGERPSQTRLYRNRSEGKICGVCAGIAEYLGADVTWVRGITVVVGVLFSPPVLIAYVGLCLLLPVRPEQLYRDDEEKVFWQSVRNAPSDTFSRVRRRFLDLEQRLRRMEGYVTSKEFEFEREINRSKR
ncbi:MAG: envelope stress response membrane protein PspC [Gammaproteobacteria bacterium]|nr:envelope stress response membrane protein PspC [Gammaproteobacteria bacterium]